MTAVPMHLAGCSAEQIGRARAAGLLPALEVPVLEVPVVARVVVYEAKEVSVDAVDAVAEKERIVAVVMRHYGVPRERVTASVQGRHAGTEPRRMALALARCCDKLPVAALTRAFSVNSSTVYGVPAKVEAAGEGATLRRLCAELGYTPPGDEPVSRPLGQLRPSPESVAVPGDAVRMPELPSVAPTDALASAVRGVCVAAAGWLRAQADKLERGTK